MYFDNKINQIIYQKIMQEVKKKLIRVDGDMYIRHTWLDEILQKYTKKPKNPRPLTLRRLKKFLTYDYKRLMFIWMVDRGARVLAGDVAGGLNPEGRRIITLQGVAYDQSRLLYFYERGYWPEDEKDHIHDDVNVVGVFFKTREEKWTARAKLRGAVHELGSFKLKKDAVKARWEFEKANALTGWNTTSSAYLFLKLFVKLFVKDEGTKKL